MADDDISESQCIIHEELEVLESIYINELKVDYNESNQPCCISLQLHPATGDEVDKKYVCMTLELHITAEYPNEVPEIIIKNSRGLGDEELLSLHTAMLDMAKERKGCPMLFEIIELAKEDLTEGNIPRCPCTICYEHFYEGDKFTRTDCYHYFHLLCLDRYVEHAKQIQQAEDSEKPKHLVDKSDGPSKVPCPVCREEIEYNTTSEMDKLPSQTDIILYKPSDDIIKWQQEMATLLEKQKAKGGVINLDEEKNKYLVTEDMLVFPSHSPRDVPPSEERKENNSEQFNRGTRVTSAKGSKSVGSKGKEQGHRPLLDNHYSNTYKGRYKHDRPYSGKYRSHPGSGRGRRDQQEERGEPRRRCQNSFEADDKNSEESLSGRRFYGRQKYNYHDHNKNRPTLESKYKNDDTHDNRRPESHGNRDDRKHGQYSNTYKKPCSDEIKGRPSFDERKEGRPKSAESKECRPSSDKKKEGRPKSSESKECRLSSDERKERRPKFAESKECRPSFDVSKNKKSDESDQKPKYSSPVDEFDTGDDLAEMKNRNKSLSSTADCNRETCKSPKTEVTDKTSDMIREECVDQESREFCQTEKGYLAGGKDSRLLSKYDSSKNSHQASSAKKDFYKEDRNCYKSSFDRPRSEREKYRHNQRFDPDKKSYPTGRGRRREGGKAKHWDQEGSITSFKETARSTYKEKIDDTSYSKSVKEMERTDRSSDNRKDGDRRNFGDVNQNNEPKFQNRKEKITHYEKFNKAETQSSQQKTANKNKSQVTSQDGHLREISKSSGGTTCVHGEPQKSFSKEKNTMQELNERKINSSKPSVPPGLSVTGPPPGFESCSSSRSNPVKPPPGFESTS